MEIYHLIACIIDVLFSLILVAFIIILISNAEKRKDIRREIPFWEEGIQGNLELIDIAHKKASQIEAKIASILKKTQTPFKGLSQILYHSNTEIFVLKIMIKIENEKLAKLKKSLPKRMFSKKAQETHQSISEEMDLVEDKIKTYFKNLCDCEAEVIHAELMMENRKTSSRED